MSNSYYNHTTYPTPNSPGSSAALRAELQAVTNGFDLLPTLTGNGYKVAMVNSTGTALIASATLQSLTITGSSIDSTSIGATTASTGAFTTLSATGNITLGDADTDTITQAASYVTGTQLKSAKVATNTLNLAAYDVDGAAYTNLITLTASNTPTLALTSTGVGTINNMSIGATTASTGAFTDLTTTGNTTLGDASADTVTINGTVQPGVVISGTSTGNALRITQLGTGNALLVEDDTNPDSSPLVVNSSGQLVVGHASAIGAGQNTNIQSNATSGFAGVSAFRWSNDSTPPRLQVGKSRSGTIGSYAIVQAEDQLGGVYFYGDDGTDLVTQAASIIATVDGTPGVNDMPGRLAFSTTSDGASTPTERVRIDSTGQTKFSYNTVVEVTDATNAALRVTQLGTGNALLVEDSTNPDSTPFVIDASGRVIQGYTASIITADDYTGTNRTAWGYQGNSANTAGALFTTWNTTATSGAGISLSRSRSATVGTQAIVSSGDSLGGIGFNGDDGTNFISAASITADVDGTPGTNDMPGRLVFSTTADGASAPTERVRISSTGQTTFSYNAIISVTDNTNAALRVTQLGTGNALLVEDSANPDSTPLVVDANGRLVVGSTAAINFPDIQGVQRIIQTQVLGNAYANSSSGIASFINSLNSGGTLTLAQSRNTTIGSHTIVSPNDTVGAIQFAGSDGTNFIRAASIAAAIDGTPGLNDMPGRLVFNTTPDGSDTPVERVRITNAGDVGVGVNAPATKLDVLGTIQAAAAATQDAVRIAGRAGGTGSFAATITTATLAASVTHTLPAITGTLATLANTSQTFTGSTSIVPATNSGTITIGAIPQTGTITVDRSQATHTLDIGVGPTLSGNTKTINFGTAGVSGSTTNINIGSAVSGSTTTTAVSGNFTVQGVTVGLGGGAVSTNTAVGASALAAETTGTSNTAVGNRALEIANGGGGGNTAVGAVAMGSMTTGDSNVAVGSLAMYAATTGVANIAIGANAMFSGILTGNYNIAIGNGAGDSLTSGSYNNFIGASSGNTVTTGSKNVILGNYDGLSGPIFQTGSNWIVFSDGDGNVRQSFDPSGNSQMGSGAAVVYCPAPSTITAAATLTNADIQAQIVNTTGATYTLTMPLGTTLETLIPWSSVDLGYDFYVINTATGTITMAANTGVTFVGRLTVLTNIAGQFRIRRTAANTFIVYRIN